ncbi:hypothetical protein ABZ876_20050 [Streptomyces sp. NPDC046931]|uniref:hypothetical protein n=1 Tax=Streptomyces sp. NPDC046931 TaxID=3154806 RepID=UPI003401E0C9
MRALPDVERKSAMFAEVYDTYRAAGLAGTATPPEGGQPPSAVEESSSPMALFPTRVLTRFTAYVPDLDALASAPFTLAAGADSRGGLPQRTASVAAEHPGSSRRAWWTRRVADRAGPGAPRFRSGRPRGSRAGAHAGVLAPHVRVSRRT